MSQFLFERLAKHHDRQSFACGVPELDEYLKRRASQDMRRRVAVVFVMSPQDDPNRIAGYYSLGSASILLDQLPAEVATKLPRYPAVPAVLIGRLARDKSFPGVGENLLLDALAKVLHHSDEVASAIVLVDAMNDSARAFYSRYGFLEISGITRRMFLPVGTVEKLLRAGT